MTSGNVCRGAGLLVLAVALLLVPTMAQKLPAGMKNADSANFTWQGFTFSTNVTAYMMMSADMCDIDMAVQVQPVRDWATAYSIYSKGKYAVRPDGTMMKFMDWTKGSAIEGKYFNNGKAMFGGKATFIVEYMDKVFEEATGKAKFNLVNSFARQLGVMFALKSHVPISYFVATLDRLDDAKVFANKPVALMHLDQAFATYSGVNLTCSPWSGLELMSKRWHTQYNCNVSKANFGIVAGFNAAQAAVRAGDQTAFKAARAKIYANLRAGQLEAMYFTGDTAEMFTLMARHMVANLTKAKAAFEKVKGDVNKTGPAGAAAMMANQMLMMANGVYNAAYNKTEPFAAQMRAIVYTLWRAFGPFVREIDPKVANTINAKMQFHMPKLKLHFMQKLRTELMPLYPKLGVTDDMIGNMFNGTTPTC